MPELGAQAARRAQVVAASRTLALCADDFGLNPQVSRAAADLAGSGRLSALSCLVNGADWSASATMLPGLPAEVTCGLHFNLTEGSPLSAALRRHWPRLPALPGLIVQAHLGRLPLAALAEEWQAQWDAFADALGRTPRFVDGHQHVHHLPGLREIVLAAARRSGVAVRNTGAVAGPGYAGKRWLIRHTGGGALQRSLQREGIPHNAVLLGVYDFQATDYRALMQAWLADCPPQGGLLFCHPGGADVSSMDPIAEARAREARYLGSEEFRDDLEAAGVSVAAGWPERSSAG